MSKCQHVMWFTDKRNHWKYTVDILSSKVKVQVVKQHTRTVIVNRQYDHLIKIKPKDSSHDMKHSTERTPKHFH